MKIIIDPKKGDPRLGPDYLDRLNELILDASIFPFLQGKTNLCLTLLAIASDGSSRWALTYNGEKDSGEKKCYVRITQGSGNMQQTFEAKGMALKMAERAKQKKYKIALLFKGQTVDQAKRLSRGIYSAFDETLDCMIIELQAWHDKTYTLKDFLQTACDRVLDEEKWKERARRLAYVVQNDLHSIRSQRIDLQLPSRASEDEYQKACEKQYRASLLDIFRRLYEYVPPDIPHPYLDSVKEDRFLHIGKELMRFWAQKTHRLCGIHGDLHCENILMDESNTEVLHLIDFSPRVQFGEARWDDGRLVGDLLEYYLTCQEEIGRKRIKMFIDTFVDTSEILTRDVDYRRGLCLGIFTMALIKLNPRGRPIQSPRLARRYLKHCLRILQKGYFSWE